MEDTQTNDSETQGLGNTIIAGQSGTWLPPEELQRALASRVTEGGNTVLDCDGIDHLDACSLQILLAFLVQEQSTGATLGLSHVSIGLAEWFGRVGATSLVELARLAQAA